MGYIAIVDYGVGNLMSVSNALSFLGFESRVTGEAAGLAAALAIKQSKNDVHNIDVDFLRKRLREEGQYFK